MVADVDDHARAEAVGEWLVELYRAIANTTMRDLPIVNPALGVEAIGFHARDGRALGIVVTPWFMNLVLAPLADSEEQPIGTTVRRALPAGNVDFVTATLDGFGSLETCSLFSPMFAFADAEVARATAQAALSALLDPAFGEPVEAPKAIDRRRLLRGGLSGLRP